MNALYHPRAGHILLRTVLALLLLFHGWAKITGGVGWLVGMLDKMGFPGWFAYAVYLGEVLAPLLLLAGVFVVPAALLVMANMIVAYLLMHQGQVLEINQSGGWALELQAFYFFSALVVMLTAKPRG
ncbi:MAG: DoxX family protein [Comamonadaceae bacterium]|nr:DoxX family protein [Burkholderiales bacterium]MEB2348803.1 DoxX family protein [Comamonadaceae bacterium]